MIKTNIYQPLQNNTFSTLFIGQNLIKLLAVDSTNNFLKSLVSNSEPLPEGTVIMADNQFAGRGQKDSHWHSEPGKNLTFSIYLLPRFLDASQQFKLNMAVSIGLNEALTEYLGPDVRIKWPNDIYYKSKKLGGMLIENVLSGQHLKSSIIGIGLNVNQQQFSPEIEGTACSLNQILQKDVNLIELLAVICSHIESEFLKLKASSGKSLKLNYLNRLYQYGISADYRHGDQVFEGVIRDITESGKLLILQNGREVAYDFKEVEFLH